MTWLIAFVLVAVSVIFGVLTATTGAVLHENKRESDACVMLVFIATSTVTAFSAGMLVMK
jgi:hypothetical protein